MDASERINDLIIIMGGLADLLGRENDALRNNRPSEATSLLEQKNTLVRAYETRVKGLAERTDDLIQVDTGLRERLRGLGERVNELMAENAPLLKVAIQANRRVVQAITDAVKSSRPAAGIYGANGSLNYGNRRAATNSVSISVDRAL